MSKDRPKRPPLSPAELLAKHDAPRREAERAAAKTAEVRAWRAAEATILAELKAVDVAVDSVWDLVGAAESYPNALPVVIEHLERGGYPDEITEALGRALGVRRAAPYWDRLVALYRNPRTAAERTGVVVALTASASAERVEELIAMVQDRSLGTSRTAFIAPILDHGARGGRRFVESLRDDPDLGEEAAAQLSKRPLRRPR
ncbi:MAG: hypothetical protein GX868_03700 [Actinobacteria bacterium]|nr:hypothetical protein [Actinomycetota bacterium]